MYHFALKGPVSCLLPVRCSCPIYCMEMTKTTFCILYVFVSLLGLFVLLQWQFIVRQLATVLNFVALPPTACQPVTRRSAISIMLNVSSSAGFKFRCDSSQYGNMAITLVTAAHTEVSGYFTYRVIK